VVFDSNIYLYNFDSILSVNKMNLQLQLIELIEKTRAFRSRINLFNFGLFVIAFSAFSIYFEFPLHEIFVAFSALFFPGYLFYRLIIKESPYVETFVLSIILSMAIIVFSTFLLTVVFSFRLDEFTVTSASVLSNVFFLGIHYIKGVLRE